MNKKVASLESQMDARVNEAVQLALSQRGTAGSHPDVVISPASQQRSSCASTAAPDVAAEHPKIEAAVEEHQRYPVDDITIPTACELHVRAKNISIHVAYCRCLDPAVQHQLVMMLRVPVPRWLMQELTQ